ncbi:MAG TPA: hypothetical protein VFV94_02400 [Polyangiaceae bacterium]|nr:hypothetical protein [Polyangiaceae bacterium]
MAAPVVIDMGVAEPAEVLVQAMVEACDKAVAEGECHLVRDAPQEPYRAIAIVTWEGPDKVRIEVGLRREQGTEWRTRGLSFQPEDVDVERFRSVGFVVGTLATEEVEQPAPEPPPPPPPPPSTVKPPPPPPPPPRPPSEERAETTSSVGIVGTIGGALDQGGPRYGAALRARLGIAPWIGVIASAGGSMRPRDDRGLSLRFLDAGLGLGFVLQKPRPIGWEAGLEGMVEHFRADATANGSTDTMSRVVPAARLELDLVGSVASPIDVVLGGNLIFRPSSTTVVVEGQSAGATGLIELGAVAGARVKL